MKKLPSILMAAAALGALSAAPKETIAAPITYDFTGAISGDQALGGSHVYTATGGPNLTAISGSYSQSGTGSPVAGDAFTAGVSKPTSLSGFCRRLRQSQLRTRL